MEHTSRELVAASAEETRGLGARLGRVLAVGVVVALVGRLGSGRTTFAQGLAQGLEVPADRHVASPTFALVNEHPGRIPFLHADLYRVRSPAELAELGLDEAYDRAAAVIEWIDRFPEAAPADHLRVTISPAPDGSRQVTVLALGPSSTRLLT